MMLMLVTVLLLTMFLTACGSSNNNSTSSNNTLKNSSETVSSSTIKVNDPGVYPIVDEKVTIKVVARANPMVENFETNEFTKWYEEKTNVHIEWELVPEQSMQEKLNLMLASGDYPDVILGLNVSPAQQMIYGSDGVFLPLNDLIDKYGQNLKEIFAEKPAVQDIITAPNGNIYALPEINECYHCSNAQKLWIYEPWLEALDLKMPTTTDEYYNVLKAFKELDPNGNGIADEIPLSVAPTGWRGSIDNFLMNAFVYNPMYGSTKRLYVHNGTVHASFMQEGWKEGLHYLNKLYEDDLLAAESFTQDSNQLIQIGENPDIPILGSSAGGHQGVFTQLAGESGRWLEYTAVAPLKGPSGAQFAPLESTGMTLGTFIITDKAKHPEIAMRWADGLYEYETTLRNNYGREGEEWRYAEAGEIGINGEPAQWSELLSYGGVQNFNWAQTGPAARSNEFRLSAVAKGDDDLEVILYKETKEKYKPYVSDEYITIPSLFLTNEQATEIADLSTTIHAYVDEMLARFVIGDLDIDSEWDTYIQTLEAMNVHRLVEIYSDVYFSQQ